MLDHVIDDRTDVSVEFFKQRTSRSGAGEDFIEPIAKVNNPSAVARLSPRVWIFVPRQLPKPVKELSILPTVASDVPGNDSLELFERPILVGVREEVQQ